METPNIPLPELLNSSVDLLDTVRAILYEVRALARVSDPQVGCALDEAIGFLQGAELSLRNAVQRCPK
jgi:hypothetical protein